MDQKFTVRGKRTSELKKGRGWAFSHGEHRLMDPPNAPAPEEAGAFQKEGSERLFRVTLKKGMRVRSLGAEKPELIS